MPLTPVSFSYCWVVLYDFECLLLSTLTLFYSFCSLHSASVFPFTVGSIQACVITFVFVSSCLLCLMFIVGLCPSVTILLTCLLVFVISNDFGFSFFIFVDIYTCYGMIGCVAFVSVTTCADALLGIIVCVPFPDSHLFEIRVRLFES